MGGVFLEGLTNGNCMEFELRDVNKKLAVLSD